MKKLLFVSLILTFISCQQIDNYLATKNVVGKYGGMVKFPDNKYGIKYGIELELTDSKHAVLHSMFGGPPLQECIGTYTTGDGYIYANWGNNGNERFKIINNNTIRLLDYPAFAGFDDSSMDSIKFNMLFTLYRTTSSDTEKILTVDQFSQYGQETVNQRTIKPLIPHLKIYRPIRRVIDTINETWTDYKGDKEIDGGIINYNSEGEDTIDGISVICFIHGEKRYCVHGSE